MAAILVMGPASYQQTFISLYPKAYIQDLVKPAQWCLKKHAYAPNFKKVDGGHIAFGACVGGWVRAWVCHTFVSTVTFKRLKLESLNFICGFIIKNS